MDTSKKISILMGIYNCASTLNEAIDSIIEQTYPNWEFIICDDGSQDNSYEIAKEYEKADPERFMVIKNSENKGLNATLNRCLKIATGEYVARMDGDDLCDPTRFQKEADFLNRHPEYAIVSTHMTTFDEEGDWGCIRTMEYPQVKDFPTHVPMFCHAPCMIRRSAFLDVKGYTEDKRLLRVEDYHLWYKFYAKGYIIFRNRYIKCVMTEMRYIEERRRQDLMEYMLHLLGLKWCTFPNGCIYMR